jgi:hypothetical protein
MVSSSISQLCSMLALAAAILSAEGAVAPAVSVDVYSGPTDCPDESRVQTGNHISIHFTGSIDELSATGTPGKKFDSSRARSKPVDITIGVGKALKGELF